MITLESFEFSTDAGQVLHTEGFPSVWITPREVEIDEKLIRHEDRAAVVAWLRAAAEAIETAPA